MLLSNDACAIVREYSKMLTSMLGHCTSLCITSFIKNLLCLVCACEEIISRSAEKTTLCFKLTYATKLSSYGSCCRKFVK